MRSTTIFAAILSAALGTSAAIAQYDNADQASLQARALPSSSVEWPEDWEFISGDGTNTGDLPHFDASHISPSNRLGKRWYFGQGGEAALDGAIRTWQRIDYDVRYKRWLANKDHAKKDVVWGTEHKPGPHPQLNTGVWNWWEDVKHIMEKNNENPGVTGPLGSLNCPNGCDKRDVVYGADGEVVVLESKNKGVGSDHEYEELGWGSQDRGDYLDT